MCRHEEKNCARCGAAFECKVGDIAHCQCSDVQLSEEETRFIAVHYSDCLCASCIKTMKTEYSVLQNQLRLKIFLQGR